MEELRRNRRENELLEPLEPRPVERMVDNTRRRRRTELAAAALLTPGIPKYAINEAVKITHTLHDDAHLNRDKRQMERIKMDEASIGQEQKARRDRRDNFVIKKDQFQIKVDKKEMMQEERKLLRGEGFAATLIDKAKIKKDQIEIKKDSKEIIKDKIQIAQDTQTVS